MRRDRGNRQRRGFDARRFVRSLEGQLVIGFFILLYGVGGTLIWYFYGASAAVVGLGCITGGLIFFLLLYGLVSLIGYLAGG